jgi:hypothetical protein
MSKLSTKAENTNYCARLIRLPAPRAHSNANKLLCVSIMGNNVITGLNATEGSPYVFFPLESSISTEYLAHSNSLDDPTLNRDKKTKGFFSSKHGRVKAISLRGEKSEGYVVPAQTLEEWSGYKFKEDDFDKDFDHIGDIKLCEKYINREALRKQNQAENRAKKGGKVKRQSRLVENQFRLSPDYKHLKKEINTVKPNDWIEITSKWHGANGVISRVLTKRKLSTVDKVAKFFGAQIVESEYGLVYASRRVIKNEFADQKTQDFYDANVWQIVAEKYKDCLQDGITLIGEVVGYTPSGKGIQSMKGKVFDYGCEVNKCDFIVFRINYTSPSGKVYEFSIQQMVDYCKKFNLKHVPIYFIGRAKELYYNLYLKHEYSHNQSEFADCGIPEDERIDGRGWHDKFLQLLVKEYLEKDDVYCQNKGLPDEGIVLSRRVDVFEGLKLKSFKFLQGETEEADKGEVDMETQESVTNNGQ